MSLLSSFILGTAIGIGGGCLGGLIQWHVYRWLDHRARLDRRVADLYWPRTSAMYRASIKHGAGHP